MFWLEVKVGICNYIRRDGHGGFSYVNTLGPSVVDCSFQMSCRECLEIRCELTIIPSLYLSPKPYPQASMDKFRRYQGPRAPDPSPSDTRGQACDQQSLPSGITVKKYMDTSLGKREAKSDGPRKGKKPMKKRKNNSRTPQPLERECSGQELRQPLGEASTHNQTYTQGEKVLSATQRPSWEKAQKNLQEDTSRIKRQLMERYQDHPKATYVQDIQFLNVLTDINDVLESELMDDPCMTAPEGLSPTFDIDFLNNIRKIVQHPRRVAIPAATLETTSKPKFQIATLRHEAECDSAKAKSGLETAQARHSIWMSRDDRLSTQKTPLAQKSPLVIDISSTTSSRSCSRSPDPQCNIQRPESSHLPGNDHSVDVQKESQPPLCSGLAKNRIWTPPRREEDPNALSHTSYHSDSSVYRDSDTCQMEATAKPFHGQLREVSISYEPKIHTNAGPQCSHINEGTHNNDIETNEPLQSEVYPADSENGQRFGEFLRQESPLAYSPVDSDLHAGTLMPVDAHPREDYHPSDTSADDQDVVQDGHHLILSAGTYRPPSALLYKDSSHQQIGQVHGISSPESPLRLRQPTIDICGSKQNRQVVGTVSPSSNSPLQQSDVTHSGPQRISSQTSEGTHHTNPSSYSMSVPMELHQSQSSSLSRMHLHSSFLPSTQNGTVQSVEEPAVPAFNSKDAEISIDQFRGESVVNAINILNVMDDISTVPTTAGSSAHSSLELTAIHAATIATPTVDSATASGATSIRDAASPHMEHVLWVEEGGVGAWKDMSLLPAATRVLLDTSWDNAFLAKERIASKLRSLMKPDNREYHYSVRGTCVGNHIISNAKMPMRFYDPSRTDRACVTCERGRRPCALFVKPDPAGVIKIGWYPRSDYLRRDKTWIDSEYWVG
jgi:hypothetical protein